jgi:outer membrane immunogenic protein
VKTNYISTVTGRIGGVFHEDVLIYLKGGAAFVQNSYNLAVSNFGMPLGNYPKLTDSRTGWTLGFGAEYRFDSRWSAKLEYDYLEFNSKTLNFPVGSAGCCSTPAFSIDVPLAVHEFKIGLNYKIW